MRSGLFLPLFDELADPATVARLSVEAEDAGWHGVFVWDQVRWGEPVAGVADPWVTLAAIATATERIRLGPMVTPLARRRPVKVARETATLDRLSGGRLTLGVGLGSDRFAREFSITGEELDDRRRARMLDESLEILSAAWSGAPVDHRGEHYTVAGMRFLPRPVQRPGVPVWVAGYDGNAKPLRRAARHRGFVPVGLGHPRPARRDRRRSDRAAPNGRHDRSTALRHRGCPRSRLRSGTVRRGRGDLVACGGRRRRGTRRPRARDHPRRTHGVGLTDIAVLRPSFGVSPCVIDAAGRPHRCAPGSRRPQYPDVVCLTPTCGRAALGPRRCGIRRRQTHRTTQRIRR
jgi:Luciferase-like monooxygenase